MTTWESKVQDHLPLRRRIWPSSYRWPCVWPSWYIWPCIWSCGHRGIWPCIWSAAMAYGRRDIYGPALVRDEDQNRETKNTMAITANGKVTSKPKILAEETALKKTVLGACTFGRLLLESLHVDAHTDIIVTMVVGSGKQRRCFRATFGNTIIMPATRKCRRLVS